TVLLATKLGAVVEEELSERTTHLVAAGRGTSKVHAASKMPHVKSVSPHWLITAAHRWEKVDERLFPIGSGGPVPLSKPLPQSNKDVPQFLTLSQEEMDAMSLEVDSLEDSENGEIRNIFIHGKIEAPHDTSWISSIPTLELLHYLPRISSLPILNLLKS
ncbi:unnamed protein product, partial [Nesidiocoris tenuis]